MPELVLSYLLVAIVPLKRGGITRMGHLHDIHSIRTTESCLSARYNYDLCLKFSTGTDLITQSA